MKIAVLSDTHIPSRARRLPELAYQIIKSSDMIIHAGDFVSPEFFNELTQCGRILAVRGNNDRDIQNLPLVEEVELGGARIAIIHDSGGKDGRRKRLRKLFPGAVAVVFGHSHIPFNESEDGFLLFNPGSPTDKRRQPAHTMGILTVENGFVRGEIVQLD